ncbi:MAG: GntR family transcriptional regulator, partial [Deltaproteobacteria bacterium]|nr:GntR family transcriptional regulator [Deltaproteobacteria bacterium]
FSKKGFWVTKKADKKKDTVDQAEETYRTIRNRIFSGSYWPRERLVEDSLAKELGVQRWLIRWTLKRLAAEKLVVSERHKGCFVAEFSAEKVFETMQAQAFLEGGAAFLATEKISDKELDQLEALIGRAEKTKAENQEKWFTYNREFHRILNNACGNKKLIDLIKMNESYLKYWFVRLSQQADLNTRNKEHVLIMEALRKRDPQKVRQAVENHVMQASVDMRGRLKDMLPL